MKQDNTSVIEYLEDNIGHYSIKTIAENLRKKPKSLETFRKRKGIPSGREAADGIPVSDFAAAVSRCSESVYDWVEKLGLPVKRIPVGITGQKEIFIDLEGFWEWAWKHKYFLDFSKIEKGILGAEPEWVHQQRKDDLSDWGKKGWDKPWTTNEDARLKSLLQTFRYTYRQLADMLHRTELSIQGRLYQIKEKLRPIEEPRRDWTQEENLRLKALFHEGYSIFQISRKLDRSELQIKAKVARLKQQETAEKEKQIALLTELLKMRRNQLAFDGYWQKEMCMNWNDVKGCKADQANCDDCTEFLRIREQYCTRCGATFFKREVSKTCSPCSAARKKQHQRKWSILHKKGKL